jgi:hypothetical protein
MTAIITLEDHSSGTDYRAHVMHKNGTDRTRTKKRAFSTGGE